MIDLRLGDCLEILPSIEANSIDLVLTDIPYNEANRESNGLRLLDKGIADDSPIDIEAFLKEATRVCRGSFYVFCGFQQVSLIDSFFRRQGISERCLVWEKTNPSPMNGESIWLSGIELCVYGKKARATFNGHCVNSVIRCPAGSSKIHPTEKPLPLFEKLMLMSSDEGDTVLDPFMGSGTTAIACMGNGLSKGRRFIGIEKDPEYFAVAEKRIRQREDEIRNSLFYEEPVVIKAAEESMNLFSEVAA